MKIIIASTVVPFIYGGGTFIVDWLNIKLREYGHTVEVFKIPFYSYYPEMMKQMLALRMFDLTDSCDRLITIRTPSYLLRHPNKVLWFIHHHRGAYDLWGTKYQDLPNNKIGKSIRSSLIDADNLAFKEARKIYTNSKVVSKRIKKYNKYDSEVLYPPLLNPDVFYSKEYGDYILYISRINSIKRQYLIVEAMKYVKTNVKLIISGYPDTKDHGQRIKKLIEENKLQNKVKFIDYWITEKEKADLYASALACAYVPLDEDSYGYPTLEAFQSKKAVITCEDSGGTLEMIQNKKNGYILPPVAKIMAETFDELFLNKQKSRELGENGFETLQEKNINWDTVIDKLTGKI